MNKTSDNMEKRIRSVKTWLDKAEQAYADDSTTKGQLQLMLAKAELQHLDEKHTPTLWQRIGYWPVVIGIIIVLSGTYYVWQQSAVPKMPATNSVELLQESEQKSNGTAGTTTLSAPETTVGKTTNSEAMNALSRTTETSKGEASTDSKIIVETNATASSQNQEANATSGTVGNTYEDSTSTATNTTQTNETVTTPVISTTQIQEAVREGGRSLRGQEQ